MAITTSFYAPPACFRGGHVVLPEDEAQHAARTLRKQPGDTIVVVDGAGGWHEVQLDHVSRGQVAGHVVTTRRNVGEPPYALTLALSPLKRRSRFETAIEKAVELGVTTIQPIQTARTEAASIRADRLERIIIAALKQCGRSCRPTLAPLRAWTTWLDAHAPPTGFICHEATDRTATLFDALRAADAREGCVCVGPEGGFTADEVAAAQDAGFRAASLGARRLRAETAALTAAHTVHLAWT
ncbi:RsmE family RNA methyltransferase [Salisaeta longa]|uniref:RsmE family RNA methyltransferase n=1 Tax=Salisaeta longa TaxID=503170 RepID=UPI0003B67F1E|nr:RsmE family RNA methyltransferase [Salisaeta longa]